MSNNKPSTIQCWEYLFVRVAGERIESINWVRLEVEPNIYDHFKTLGEEGWELVCFVDEYDQFIFKRPVQTEVATQRTMRDEQERDDQ